MLPVLILHKETQHSLNSASKVQDQIILMFQALKKFQWTHQQLKCGLHFEDTTVIQKAGKLASVSLHLFLFQPQRERTYVSEKIASHYVATSYTDS